MCPMSKMSDVSIMSDMSDVSDVSDAHCSHRALQLKKNFWKILGYGIHNHMWGQLHTKRFLILSERILKKLKFSIFYILKVLF